MAIESVNSPQQTGRERSGSLQVRIKTVLERLQRRRTLNHDERMFFLEQLSLLLDSGVSLYPALQMVAEQSSSPVLARVTLTIAANVAGGKPLSQAIVGNGFTSTYVSLLEAAERGGFLSAVLAELLTMEERKAELRSTVISALTYPLFLTFFSIVVVVFILVVVFPQFAEMFAGIYDRLPATTKILMRASDYLIHSWQVIVAGLSASLAALVVWLRTDRGQHLTNRLMVTLPVIRAVVIPVNLVQMFRLLGMSLKRGVIISDALVAVERSVGNAHLRAVIRDVGDSVQRGEGLAQALRKSPLMPSLVCQLIDTGEQAGKMAYVSARIADHYEKGLRKQLDTVAKLAEPVMLLVMGLIVGVLVSSLILPIFKLSSSVA